MLLCTFMDGGERLILVRSVRPIRELRSCAGELHYDGELRSFAGELQETRLYRVIHIRSFCLSLFLRDILEKVAFGSLRCSRAEKKATVAFFCGIYWKCGVPVHQRQGFSNLKHAK